MSRLLVKVIALLALLQGNQLPALPSLLEHPGQPLLVCVGTEAELGSHRAAFMALMDVDQILDMRVKGILIHKERAGGQRVLTALNRVLPTMALPRAGWFWILLGKDDQIVEKGAGALTPDGIVQALESAGEPNPVKILTRFLEQHPDHLDARIDLVKALQPRLGARLRKFTVLARDGTDLPPEWDAVVWGAVAKELERLFMEDTWFLDERNLDSLLPEGVPEKFSPSIRGVYRKALTKVSEGLRQFPANRPGWENLLRMREALPGVSMVETLEAVKWYALPPSRIPLVPYGRMAAAMFSEARTSGEWNRTAEVLNPLWLQLARTNLLAMDKASLLPETADAVEKDAWVRREREDVWEQVVGPLIQTLIYSGSETRARQVLESLDATWASIDLDSRIRILAKGAGRPDLAKALLEGAARLPERSALGDGPDLPRLQAFLEAFPDHLLARAAEIVQRCEITEQFVIGRRTLISQAEPAPQEAQAWRARFLAQDRFLTDPLALAQGPLELARISLPRHGSLDDELEAEADGLARRHIQEVESALGRRPCDPDLWGLWKELARRLGKPLAPFMAGLAPSPCTPTGTFPPPCILADLAREYLEAGRWADLVNLMQQMKREGVDGGLYFGKAEGFSFMEGRNLFPPYLESLIRLGNMAEADDLFRKIRTENLDVADAEVKRLCRIAEAVGGAEWARRWDPAS